MSKRRRNMLVALVLVLTAALAGLDHSALKSGRQPQAKSEEQVRAYDLQKFHARTFTVLKVVDGDTIDINVPDGKYRHTRIRLLGIDALETRGTEPAVHRLGREAAEFVRKTALKKEVTVYLDEGDHTRGKYGRLLAYVQLPDETFLNELLVVEGFAFADLRFHHSYYNKYQQLQAVALKQSRGLWPRLTRRQLPQWLRERKPNLLLEK